MYSDDNETALKRLHDFCRTYGVAKLGVQLAHAGRKAPTTPPAAGGKPMLTKEECGWIPEAESSETIEAATSDGSPSAYTALAPGRFKWFFRD
jgi:2,4-dienoyl-CoA reductase-like NADH-dependent reductase (Old Yellow Enzyme family)